VYEIFVGYSWKFDNMTMFLIPNLTTTTQASHTTVCVIYFYTKFRFNNRSTVITYCHRTTGREMQTQ